MFGGFTELTIIIVLAALFGIIAKLLKQPTILAYIAVGVVIGSYNFFEISNRDTWEIFADLGIMFLLFLVGLEINYSSLKKVGKHSAYIGVGQVIFTFVFGFLISRGLGIALLPASYIAVALTFSSTIIVVKLLSEKRDLTSLYGKLSIGFLLVQDIIVIFILIIVSGVQSGDGASFFTIIFTMIKGVMLFGIMLALGRKVVPIIFDSIAGNKKLLFIISLAWAFGIVSIVESLGFSIEIGGFLAGLSLANSAEHWQIGSRVKTLRDFFLLLFFALLGSTVAFANFEVVLLPILILSIFVLIGNPLIVLIIMGFMGYTKRTSFRAGITVAQVSEFSLVLAAMGLSVGHLEETHVAIVTGVGIITITLSTYMFTHSDVLYKILTPFLSLFEKKHTLEETGDSVVWSKKIILIGCKRIGEGIIAALPKKHVLVIDFDPDVIERLNDGGYDYLFDDMSDPDVFDHINLDVAELIISTARGYSENSALLERVKDLKKEKIKKKYNIESALYDEEAKLLYNEGADYVLLPYLTSGYYLGKSLSRKKPHEFLHNIRFRDQQLMQREDPEVPK